MNKISVEVVYAQLNLQTVVSIDLAEDSTILTAIEESKILTLFPELELDELCIGIFGAIKSLDTILADGDRVEIYRPLVIDPKQARLDRVKIQKQQQAKKQKK